MRLPSCTAKVCGLLFSCSHLFFSLSIFLFSAAFFIRGERELPLRFYLAVFGVLNFTRLPSVFERKVVVLLDISKMYISYKHLIYGDT